MFIAQLLEGPSKQLKRVFQIEHNIVKNPNLPESNQLAIYNRGRELEGWIASPTCTATLPSGQPMTQSFDCIIVIWENRHEKDEDSYAW